MPPSATPASRRNELEEAGRSQARLSVAPGSAFAVGRTWTAVALLAVAYRFPWLLIQRSYPRDQAFWFHSIKGTGTVTGLDGTSSVGFVEMPWYYALVGLVAAAGLRTMRWRNVHIAESWPWALTVLGLMMTSWTAVAAAASHQIEARYGLLMALSIFAGSSVVDLAAFLERRQLNRNMRRPRAEYGGARQRWLGSTPEDRVRRRRRRREREQSPSNPHRSAQVLGTQVAPIGRSDDGGRPRDAVPTPRRSRLGLPWTTAAGPGTFLQASSV